MKSDKTMLVAILVLICLVAWLLVISMQRNHEVSKAVEQLQNVSTQKPVVIDYSRIEAAVKQEVDKKINSLPIPKNGTDGQNGTNGANGISGTNGVNGQNGEGVYQLWLNAGNSGTAQDFLNSLKGEKGDAGVVPLLRIHNGQLESKLPTDLFWQIVPTCQEEC